jgi:hypothetical protein
MMRSFLLFIVLLLVGSGCTPVCAPGQTRCVDASAQVCLANGQWREFERCPDVAKQSGGTWHCAPSPSVDGGVTCTGSPFCALTEPSPELVQAFWSYMEGIYGSTRIDKSNAPEMQLVADVLDVLGIEDEQTFLTRYTTTIGSRIYTPFEPGVPTTGYPLWGQVVIGAHESQHVSQFRTEGIDFMARYLTSAADRAEYEAEAYRCAAELDWWRYGQLDDPKALADRLQAYNCTAQDIASADEILRLSEDTIERGGLVSSAAAAAIDWLDRNAAGLKRHPA